MDKEASRNPLLSIFATILSFAFLIISMSILFVISALVEGFKLLRSRLTESPQDRRLMERSIRTKGRLAEERDFRFGGISIGRDLG